MGPIKNRWQGQWTQAKVRKDKDLKTLLQSFRADVISYRNAWQFLSQIVDYQDADLHKRAILATLLSRNLHMDGEQYDDSYLEGVQLSGVKLVPSAINEDHSLTEGSHDGIKLPGFEGEFKGGSTPARGPLDDAIDRVNEMFRAKGVDVTHGSVAGFITTWWGFLDADEEAKAMAKNNSAGQLKASSDFSNAVDLAMLKTYQESQEIQSYMTDPSIRQELVEIAADVLHAQYNSTTGADTATDEE